MPVYAAPGTLAGYRSSGLFCPSASTKAHLCCCTSRKSAVASLQFATVQASQSQTQDYNLYTYFIYVCVDISLYLRRYICLYVYAHLAGCVLQVAAALGSCALTLLEKRMPLRLSPRLPWLLHPRPLTAEESYPHSQASIASAASATASSSSSSSSETSSIFELDNIQNEAILRDLVFELDNVKNESILRDILNFRSWEHQKRSNSARLPSKKWKVECGLVPLRLRFSHSICLKHCACHKKIRPGCTKCCTCHAKSS